MSQKKCICFVYLYSVKKLIPILLIFSFLSLSFKESVIVGFYQVNKEYITKNFCVNKAKPEMKCDGKCHMKKMLKKSKKKEQESFPEGSLELKTITFIKSSFSANYRLIDFELINSVTPYQEHLIGTFSINDIFHPPQV